jgi:hypothetical protein
VTLTQSDVTSLLDAIHAGGDIEIIRKGVELVLQALIEAEATEHIGATRYERADAHTNQGNGSGVMGSCGSGRCGPISALHRHGSAPVPRRACLPARRLSAWP